MLTLRGKGHGGPDGLGGVDKIERGAEEARESVGEGPPALRRLSLVVGVDPRPQLNARAALARAIPGPLPPVVGIPAADAEAQVKLVGVSMLQDLAQRAGEVAEVLAGKRRRRLVAAEAERGQ